MKLSKTEFKKILKQCIKELIVEGAFNNVIKENVGHVSPEPARVASNDLVSNNQQQPSNNFNPFTSSVGQSSPNERMRELVRMTAMHSANGNEKQAAIMENILTDTAQTTYLKQRGAEGTGAAGMGGKTYVSKEEEQYDKAQLDALNGIGGNKGSNHWAALAFGKYEKK